jgi:citrate lyase subunit beta/citryl-CoA lyase
MREVRIRRSELTCPAHSPKMMAKAASCEADEVILDLEDACAPSQKTAARTTLIEALRTLDFGKKVRAFRPNALSTRFFFDDMNEVLRGAGACVDAVVLPKVESAAQVKRVDQLLTELEATLGLLSGRIELEVLIESARGLLAAEAIAQASPRLVSLIFGIADYAADVGAKDILGGSWDLYLYPRSRLLAVARAHGLLAIDSVTVQFRDLAQVKTDAKAGARLGLDGKWAVHPTHLEIIHAAYTPSRAELERALAVVRAAEEADLQAGTGAFVYGEEMIDEAGVRLERRKVALARRAGLLGPPGEEKAP